MHVRIQQTTFKYKTSTICQPHSSQSAHKLKSSCIRHLVLHDSTACCRRSCHSYGVGPPYHIRHPEHYRHNSSQQTDNKHFMQPQQLRQHVLCSFVNNNLSQHNNNSNHHHQKQQEQEQDGDGISNLDTDPTGSSLMQSHTQQQQQTIDMLDTLLNIGHHDSQHDNSTPQPHGALAEDSNTPQTAKSVSPDDDGQVARSKVAADGGGDAEQQKQASHMYEDDDDFSLMDDPLIWELMGINGMDEYLQMRHAK